MGENIQEQLILNQQQSTRKLDPRDILLPPGYKIEVFATGLTTPINLTFTSKGEMLVVWVPVQQTIQIMNYNCIK